MIRELTTVIFRTHHRYRENFSVAAIFLCTIIAVSLLACRSSAGEAED